MPILRQMEKGKTLKKNCYHLPLNQLNNKLRSGYIVA